MFKKLLIANRGEIACRIARTGRRLGIPTVGVFSDADAGAAHLTAVSESVRIGPGPAVDSYLNIGALIEAARRTGADAVHPGYGFLSENAAFAEACAQAGITFVGPPPAAIRAMGDKAAARKLMAAAGVPVVPGYDGEDQAPDTLRAQAARIGFPVLVKAVAGGGGRGMRIAESPKSLDEAVAAARREAGAAFGNETVLLEHLVRRPRHVEVQVFGDSHGNAMHLFERDCSVQRRHQKVIEEAPAPAMDASVRRAMLEAGVLAARSVDYVGAGTVEFLLDPKGNFYFIEMNTRLQVEHPVTELITGLDLVEWQLRVADGEPLPLDQESIDVDGHAIEVRLYAEDPARDFRPSPGRVLHIQLPPEDGHVRVDAGYRSGDTVPSFYDAMMAKVIAWGPTRKAAVSRLSEALTETAVIGPRCNLDYLRALVGHPAFVEGDLDTGFVDRHAEALRPDSQPLGHPALTLASLAVLLSRSGLAGTEGPWASLEGFRLNLPAREQLVFAAAGQAGPREPGAHASPPIVVEALALRHVGLSGAYRLSMPSATVDAVGTMGEDSRLHAEIDGIRQSATIIFTADPHGQAITVIGRDGTHHLILVDPLRPPESAREHDGRLTAPMPGRIAAIHAAVGDSVAAGAPLLVVEAMKMEHVIRAPMDGVVESIRFAVGDLVGEEALLVQLKVREDMPA